MSDTFHTVNNWTCKIIGGISSKNRGTKYTHDYFEKFNGETSRSVHMCEEHKFADTKKCENFEYHTRDMIHSLISAVIQGTEKIVSISI